MEYRVKKLDELTTLEFCRIVQERIAVFVVEQNCPYQEVDAVDEWAWHTYLEDEDGTILAYTRIYEEADAIHFGRVLVNQKYRKDGLGRQIVQQTIETIEEKYPEMPILIGAQEYLRSFYESFGFEAVSDVYLEDDIPHIDMRKA
ncbi:MULTISPECIES: GNAT family N-acetyltransferase [unclassified Enterococcus]|uniref:GNAT family N-acetyltransferase n=1 Tax=unclassified Enterococcus TaxID=2608891 RepID=UPI0013EAD7A7|nr:MULTISPECIES: GNAT family N-acetyltransferase [unclassified Enterococcus]